MLGLMSQNFIRKREKGIIVLVAKCISMELEVLGEQEQHETPSQRDPAAAQEERGVAIYVRVLFLCNLGSKKQLDLQGSFLNFNIINTEICIYIHYSTAHTKAQTRAQTRSQQ